MLYLPDPILEQIFSFFNPYKNYFTTHVLVNLKSRLIYKTLMKQLKSYSVYNKERQLIKFYKYSLLKTVRYKCDNETKVRRYNSSKRRRRI